MGYNGSDTIRPEWTEILGVVLIVVLMQVAVSRINLPLVGVMDDHVGGSGQFLAAQNLEYLFE